MIDTFCISKIYENVSIITLICNPSFYQKHNNTVILGPSFFNTKVSPIEKKTKHLFKNIGWKIMKLCPNIQTCQSLQLIKSNVFIKNMLLSWIYVLHHYQWGIRWIWWIKTFLTVIYFLKINKYNIIYENVSIITLI